MRSDCNVLEQGECWHVLMGLLVTMVVMMRVPGVTPLQLVTRPSLPSKVLVTAT